VSEGVRLTELAELMLERGAVTAINLDGGGSSTLVVRRAGTETPVIANKPSDGVERPVTNSIQVVSTMPTGPLSVLNVQPAAKSVYKNTTIDFTASGMDAGYNPVPIPAGQLAWSLTAPIGTIDANGHFVATSPGTAQVVATAIGTSASGQLGASAEVTGTAPITVLADTSAPVATAPRVTLPAGRGIGTGGVPVTVAWDAATDEGSGVASYELQRSVDGHAWTTMPKASPAARTTSLTLPRNRTYQFQVRAVDVAGNVGAWMTAGTFKLTVSQEATRSLVFVRGTWSRTTSVSYDGHMTRTTRTIGGIARFTFSGTGFAWVAAESPVRGAAEVWIDGKLSGTVNTYRAASAARLMVFTRSTMSSGRHTVEIRALGTAGHPRVDIDALVTITPVSGTTPPPLSTPGPAPAPTPTPPPGPAPTPNPTPTPTPAGSSAVLVGAGDIASCGLTADTATAKLVAGISGTVFAAGDEAYESGSAADFKNCYTPTWGPFLDRTYPAPGNHEYVTSGAAGYFDYFGARAGPAGAGWYAYNLGSWRIYSLNANCTEVGCGVGSEQEQWLRADLATSPHACVLAYWHQPRFSSGLHGNDASMAAFWDDLYAAGADVVINGHDHDYERFAPQSPSGKADAVTGIREFVVGTGGASLRSFSTIRANSQVRNSSTHGVLKLTLSVTGYTWQFIPIAGQTFKDSGTGTCH
jgi:hypothetical protein